MGLFDKIKDNAKNISIRALEDTESDAYPETADYPAENPETGVIAPSPATIAEPAPQTEVKPTSKTPEKKEPEPTKKPEQPKETKSDQKPAAPKTNPLIKLPAPEKSLPARTSVTRTPASKSPFKSTDDIRPPKANVSRTPAPAGKKVLDVTPHKPVEPAKQAIYARERAAMTALAAQRRMNGSVPLYVTSHLNFKTRVYIDRIEYSGSFGKNVLPIDQVGWVKLRAGGTGIILETTEGKRVVMVVKPKDRLEFADAVLKVQAMQPKREKFKDTQTVRLDQLEKLGEGVDEIEKLAKLYEKGILTLEEFEAKKKQILGI
jgi:hypothetical protein